MIRAGEQRERRTPVMILSGFLGSGKTSVVQYMIERASEDGYVLAVVMNERGPLNVERETISVPVVDVLNGCLCCVLRGAVEPLLTQLLRDHDPDAIVIECSGISTPAEVLEKVTEAALTLPIEVTQLVTVVDGARLADDAPLPGRFQRLLRNQVQCATDVMVNKCDVVAHPERVAEMVRSWKADVPITYTINGRPNAGNEAVRMPWERVVRYNATDLSVRSPEPAQDHGAKPLQVVCWEHIPDIATDQWKTWLDQWSSQLYRAKGIVRIDGRRYLLQFAYKAHAWTPLPEQNDAKTVLILIGEWTDSEAMERSLRTNQVMAR